MKHSVQKKVISDSALIKEHLTLFSNQLPSEVRIPYLNDSGKFNVSYYLLAGCKDKLYFYQNEYVDYQRGKFSSLRCNENNEFQCSVMVEKELWLLAYKKTELRSIQDREKEETLSHLRLHFHSQDVFLKPAICHFKKDFLDQSFLNIIFLPFPQRISIELQRRTSPRISIPAKINPQLKIKAPKKNNISIDYPLKDQTKVVVVKFWNFCMLQDHSLVRSLMQFFQKIPNCIFSPYFDIDLILQDKPVEWKNFEKNVNCQYNSFKSVREIVEKNTNPVFFSQSLIIPLSIYGETAGHFIILKAKEEQVSYLKKMVEVLGTKFAQSPEFDIGDRDSQELLDISYKGLRFRSTNPKHRLLKKNSRFTCEFNLNWVSSTPLSMQVKTTRMLSENSEDGTVSSNIACAYLKEPLNDKSSFKRIKKFVDDHTDYTRR